MDVLHGYNNHIFTSICLEFVVLIYFDDDPHMVATLNMCGSRKVILLIKIL